MASGKSATLPFAFAPEAGMMSVQAPTPIRKRTQLDLLSDTQLLERFSGRGDQGAFAALVYRHGPLVLGVCRRVLQHDQDTEDAFQAAFVVLARKAGTISKHESLASWLYKVAYRIALRARSDKARRHSHEQQTPPRPPDPALGEVVQRELQQILDEEVQRLPEKYRAPILLCYLQGQTNEEAATVLRCPTGTVKVRLLRGREILRKRLLRRGLALSVTALLGQALVHMARAAVPQPLAKATVQAAAGGFSPVVAGLADGILKGMCLAKLKVAAVLLLTVALACLADGLLGRATAAAPPPLPEQRRIMRPVEPPATFTHEAAWQMSRSR
jgi:RNA polymerase sigma factor (sigma-70 family)